MSANSYNYSTMPRKNVRSVKAKNNNLACNQQVVAVGKENNNSSGSGSGSRSLPRKLYNTIRRSLHREPSLRLRTDEERKMHEELEALEYERLAQDPNRPSMEFDHLGRNAHDEKLSQYHRMGYLDKEKAIIGGSIKLHQHCYRKYKQTAEPIYRDAANFWKEVDPLCFNTNDRIPIRMCYLNLYTCAKIEPWYRDYYTSRDLDRLNLRSFNQDSMTDFDRLFEEMGREMPFAMVQEMEQLADFCRVKNLMTGLSSFIRGEEFWKTASPMHFPRNYQLALFMSKAKKWPHEEIEDWFSMLYTENCFRGARGFDVYPLGN